MPRPIKTFGCEPEKLLRLCLPAGSSKGKEGGRQGEEGEGGPQEAGGELSLMMPLPVAAVAVLACQ